VSVGFEVNSFADTQESRSSCVESRSLTTGHSVGLRRLASGVVLVPIVEKASDHLRYATFAVIGAAGLDSGGQETLRV
jgi:hypothetical protein